MIIECSDCDARFRMKESMLEGFRGAQVRCRRCGGTFTVEKSGVWTPRPGTASTETRAHRKATPAGGQTRPKAPPAETQVRSKAAPLEAHARPKAAPAETHARPKGALNNVYPLARFRQGAARKPVAGGFDISGRLRPAPEGASDVSIPWAAAFSVAAASEPLPERIPPSHLDESPPEPGEDTAALQAAPDQGKASRWLFGSLRRSRGDANASRLCFPRPLHIAAVYLLLLVLGGFAFLLVRFLSEPILRLH